MAEVNAGQAPSNGYMYRGCTWQWLDFFASLQKEPHALYWKSPGLVEVQAVLAVTPAPAVPSRLLQLSSTTNMGTSLRHAAILPRAAPKDAARRTSRSVAATLPPAL